MKNMRRPAHRGKGKAGVGARIGQRNPHERQRQKRLVEWFAAKKRGDLEVPGSWCGLVHVEDENVSGSRLARW